MVAQHPVSSLTRSEAPSPWVVLSLWLAAVVLGALQAWADRFVMNADGISYLDIGEAYMKGEWSAAINAYWSPLYSWFLGAAIFALEPTSYWEFPVAHLVNFIIYICALTCFHFFLREIMAYRRTWIDGLTKEAVATLPAWAWYALGYAFFIWSSLGMITLSFVTPDLCVAALVFLASGILLRIRRGATSWSAYGLLGLVLGFGYLAKAPMFPLVFVFLGVAALSAENLRRGVLLGLVTLISFLVIAAPFILALTMTKARLTFGDSAKLNYAIRMHRAPPRHWQGQRPAGIGTPKHPTRKVFDKPAVYEFGSPVAGTYPPWYDPSYWNEGISPQFDLKRQVKVVLWNLQGRLPRFLRSQAALIVGPLFLLLTAAFWQGIFRSRDLTYQLPFLPAFAGLAMYSLIIMNNRYVAPFFIIFCLGIISAVRLPKSQRTRIVVHAVVLIVVASIMVKVGLFTAPKAEATTDELLNGTNRLEHPQWQIAEGLRQAGVRPGDRVGVIGLGSFPFSAYWARLGPVKIVAEIISRDVKEFLAADAGTRSRVMEAFARAGAAVVIAEKLPSQLTQEGWQKVGNTDHFVYHLQTILSKAQ